MHGSYPDISVIIETFKLCMEIPTLHAMIIDVVHYINLLVYLSWSTQSNSVSIYSL